MPLQNSHFKAYFSGCFQRCHSQMDLASFVIYERCALRFCWGWWEGIWISFFWRQQSFPSAVLHLILECDSVDFMTFMIRCNLTDCLIVTSDHDMVGLLGFGLLLTSDNSHNFSGSQLTCLWNKNNFAQCHSQWGLFTAWSLLTEVRIKG